MDYDYFTSCPDGLNNLTITGAGMGQTVIDCEGTNRILRLGGNNYSTGIVTIANMTLRSGRYDTALPNSNRNAGGGGGLWSFGVHVTLENVLFDNCSSAFAGGAIRMMVPPLTTNGLSNCAFTNNRSPNGGAIFVADSDIAFNGPYMTGWNSVTGYTAPWYVGMTTIENCTFEGNVAYGLADQTAGYGGALSAIRVSIVVQSCEFSNNTATYSGGSINLAGVNMTVLDCLVTSSVVQQYINRGGGGICIQESTGIVQRITVTNCRAIWGGGVMVINNTAINGSVVVIQDAWIADNSATDGGGFMIISLADSTTTTPYTNFTLRNNHAVRRGGGAFYFLNRRDGVLTGFSIVNCSADYGGGLFAWVNPTQQDQPPLNIVLNVSQLIGNTGRVDGGGLYLRDIGFLSWNSNISGNTAARNGGGLCAANDGSLLGRSPWSMEARFTDTEIANNRAILGGGIYLDNLFNTTLRTSVLSGNRAVQGGGQYQFNTTTFIMDSTVSYNVADQAGGAIYTAPIFSRDTAQFTSVTVVGSKFVGNSLGVDGHAGGGLYLQTANFQSSASTYSHNGASRGGAIAFDFVGNGPSYMVLNGDTFSNNTAAIEGGGVDLCYYSCGAGAFPFNYSASHVSFAGNLAEYGRDFASDPYVIAEESIASQSPSGFSINPVVTLRDFFNQVITSGLSDLNVALNATVNAQLESTGLSLLRNGTCSFPTLNIVTASLSDAVSTYSVNFYHPAVPNNLTASIKLLPCPGGYGLDAGLLPSVSCQICAPGNYSTSDNLAICDACPPNTYASSPGSTECTVCPQNYASAGGSAICTACPAGQQSSNGTSCVYCAEGEISQEGQSCTPCSIGKTSKNGECVDCGTGTFNEYSPGSCFACPVDVQGCSTCTKTGVFANAGCFRIPATPSPDGAYSFQRCDSGRCLENNTCAEGYTGALCSFCADDYSRWNGKCIPCQKPNGGIFALWIFLIVIFALYIVYIQNSKDALFAILTFFGQVMVLLVQHNVSLPVTVTAIWSLFNLTPDFFPNSCPARIPFPGASLLGLVPLVGVGVVVWICYGLERLCGKKVNCVDRLPECIRPLFDKAKKRQRYRKAFFSVLLFAYQPFMVIILQLLNCRASPLLDGSTVLFIDPTIGCTAPNGSVLAGYLGYRVVAALIIAIIIYPVPIYILSFLIWLKRNRDLNDVDVRKRYGQLFLPYASRFFWWEAYTQLRKVVVVTIVVFNGPDSYQMFLIFLLFFGALLIIHLIARPYRMRSDNLAEGMTLTLLTLSCAFLSSAWMQANAASIGTRGLAVAVLCICVVPVGFIGVKVWEELVKRGVCPKKIAAEEEEDSRRKTIDFETDAESDYPDDLSTRGSVNLRGSVALDTLSTPGRRDSSLDMIAGGKPQETDVKNPVYDK